MSRGLRSIFAEPSEGGGGRLGALENYAQFVGQLVARDSLIHSWKRGEVSSKGLSCVYVLRMEEEWG